MRLLLQRVSGARVDVAGRVTGEIGPGLLVLAGFGADDGGDMPESRLWRTMVSKVFDLRIFPDERGRMNKSLGDVGGDVLVVSQFTLYADARKGRRPSFTSAAPPETAERLYNALVENLAAEAPAKVATGEFGALMDVRLVNAGPVTIMLDSSDFA